MLAFSATSYTAMSHKHVDHLREKIKAKCASKGVNADSVQDTIQDVEGVVHRKPLQKSTERGHAVERLHFSIFLEDIDRDPVETMKKGAPTLTVAEWEAYIRARAKTTDAGIAGAAGASVRTIKGRFQAMHSIVSDSSRRFALTRVEWSRETGNFLTKQEKEDVLGYIASDLKNELKLTTKARDQPTASAADFARIPSHVFEA